MRRCPVRSGLLLAMAPVLLVGGVTAQALGPVPVPVENPITPEKALLGKILFWDEQMASDGTVACGTCHFPEVGGVDPRLAIHPGSDGVVGTEDDVHGAAGIIRSDSLGDYEPSNVFGFQPQVTPRSVPTNIGAAFFSKFQTWSGLAIEFFVDPETLTLEIFGDGALESHHVGPPIIDIEMAYKSRTWFDISAKMAAVDPLRLATNLPQDIVDALAVDPTYPELFEMAYGDPAVTARRIIFALATYQRTLIPDQTPYDDFIGGNTSALTADQQAGLALFNGKANCHLCHTPGLFSDKQFRNIGLRPLAEDPGRFIHTSNPADLGKFKVPTLRNAGLRPRFMHTGRLESLADVVDFYDQGAGQFTTNKDPLLVPLGLTQTEKDQLVDFLTNALTDPRVASASYPFDRPTLFSEAGVPTPFGGESAGTGGFIPQMMATTPFSLNNPNFRIGISNALGGAPAVFAVTVAPGPPGQQFNGVPLNILLSPLPAIVPLVLQGTGPGGGYATLRFPTSTNPAHAGAQVASQWLVFDLAAPGQLAVTKGIVDSLF